MAQEPKLSVFHNEQKHRRTELPVLLSPRHVGTFVAFLMGVLKLNAESFQRTGAINSLRRLLKEEKMHNFDCFDRKAVNQIKSYSIWL